MAGATTDILDGLSSSVAVKGPCACATTGNVVLSGEQTIDGVHTAASRVLVKSQTDTRENGIYLTSTGVWRRTRDFSRNDDVVDGTLIVVIGGATNIGIWGVDITGDMNFDTTSIAFANLVTLTGGVTLGALTIILGSYLTIASATATFLTIAAAALAYMPIAGGTFTGPVSGPTPAAGDSDTSFATTAFVQGELAPAIVAMRAYQFEVHGAI